MGKCFHGFHDSTPIMEWDGCHISCSQSIFEVGQDGGDQDGHDHLWNDNVVLACGWDIMGCFNS